MPVDAVIVDPAARRDQTKRRMSTSKIPFVDLGTVHRELRGELRSVFEPRSTPPGSLGAPWSRSSNATFAAFCGSRFCVGMASGTDALRLALIAAGVQLVTLWWRCRSPSSPRRRRSSQAGARPDFVDIDERTYTHGS